MTSRFFHLAFTPDVQAQQSAHGSRQAYARASSRHSVDKPDIFTVDETNFIVASDTFFIATVSETGWPYVQHRGGSPGFVKVLNGANQIDTQLAWAEYTGNRQYVTTGNAVHDSRVAMIFMDFVHRRRLKVLGHLTAYEPQQRPDLNVWFGSEDPSSIERLMTVRVEAYDWNCPQHIVPRFTVPEVEAFIAPLRARIKQLEAKRDMRPPNNMPKIAD